MHIKYYLPTVEIEGYNVMIDGIKPFRSTSKKYDLRTNDNIRNILTGQGDDYLTGFLLDYNYFNKYYRMIAIDLSKQQELDAEAKVKQQINFKGNLAWEANTNTTMFFIIEEAKRTIKELWKYYKFILHIIIDDPRLL